MQHKQTPSTNSKTALVNINKKEGKEIENMTDWRDNHRKRCAQTIIHV